MMPSIVAKISLTLTDSMTISTPALFDLYAMDLDNKFRGYQSV